MRSVTRNARSLFGGITACPRSHRTAAAGRLFLTCCLMTSGGSWLVGWKSWFNVTGSAAPPVMLNVSTFMIKLNFYAYGLFRKIMEFDCSHLRICMEEEPECMGEYFCFQNYSSFLLTFLVLFRSLVPSLCYPSFLPSSFLCFSKISAINLRNMGNFCIYYFHMTKLQSWVWKTREFLKVTCVEAPFICLWILMLICFWQMTKHYLGAWALCCQTLWILSCCSPRCPPRFQNSVRAECHRSCLDSSSRSVV